MTRHGRKTCFFVTILVVLCLLSGCGRRANLSEYVKSTLDAAYKGSYKPYIRMTSCSGESAKQLHENRLNTCMSYVENAGISDELQEEYRKFFENYLGSVHYSVTQVKAEDKVHKVTVKVEPYSMFTDIEQELSDAVDDYYTDVTTSAVVSGTALPNNQEAREKVYELLLNILENHMQHITYGEEEELTVRVTEESTNKFSINKDDLKEIDNTLMDMTAMGF